MVSQFDREEIKNNVKIVFSNKVLYDLFNCEISGQLSDGHWENRKNMEYWWIPETEFHPTGESRIEVKKGHNFIASFYTTHHVNLNASTLIDAVGDRMMAYIAASTVDIEYDVITREGVEHMWESVLEGKTAEEAYGSLKKKAEDGNGWSKVVFDKVKQIAPDEETFKKEYTKLVKYFHVYLSGTDGHANKKGKARKIVSDTLKAMSNVLKVVKIVD